VNYLATKKPSGICNQCIKFVVAPLVVDFFLKETQQEHLARFIVVHPNMHGSSSTESMPFKFQRMGNNGKSYTSIIL